MSTRQIETVRRILEIRDSAIADLNAAGPSKMAHQWAADRLADVNYANRQIQAIADRIGVGPASLVAACR
jgi:hypothetical protein